MHKPPTAFIPTHSPALHPEPHPARFVEPARPVLPRVVPVRTGVTITVSRARRVLLAKALLQALNLQPNQRIDLVPQSRGLPWLLDTQSRTGPQLRYRRDGKAWLTLAHHLGPEHFYRVNTVLHRNELGRIVHSQNEHRALPTLTLTLTTEDPARPGIYFLQPA